MENKKMTNLVAMETALNIVKENGGSTELIEKLEKIRDSFQKKKEEKKKTGTQLENEKFKESIVFFLTTSEGKKFTATELTKELAVLGELSNQRVTSLLTALVKEGKIERVVEKRKAFFFA